MSKFTCTPAVPDVKRKPCNQRGSSWGDFEILPPFKKLGTAPRMENISVNEVLDVHNFLKDFKGDFKIFETNKTKLLKPQRHVHPALFFHSRP